MAIKTQSLVKTVKQDDILDRGKYPIANGQKYITDAGIFYEDKDGERVAHSLVRVIEKQIGEGVNWFHEKYKDQLVVFEELESTPLNPIFSLYFISSKGDRFLIGQYGGGADIPDPLPIERIREKTAVPNGTPENYSNIHFLIADNGEGNIAGDIIIKPRSGGSSSPNVVKIINPDIDAGGW